MRSFIALGLAAATSCARCSSPVVATARELRFEPISLTLGPTYVGRPVDGLVTLKNASKAALDVRLEVEGPFVIDTKNVKLAHGAEVDIGVRFNALQPGMSAGKIVSLDDFAEVQLIGLADAVPNCSPSSQCQSSTFDVALGVCVESPLADGSTCGVGSACESAGVCALGTCIQKPVSCSPTNDPCKVASCDAEVGCVQTPVADGTSCGTADCTGTPACRMGACVRDSTRVPSSCMTPMTGRIALAGTPYGLATDSSAIAYVTLVTADKVARVDVVQGRLISEVVVGSQPVGAAITGNRLIVTNQASSNLTPIDLPGFSPAPQLSLSMTPYIPFASGGFLYVSGAGPELVKADPTGTTVVSRLTGTWSHANGIAQHPRQPTLYVSARDSAEVTEVNLGQFAIGRQFSQGVRPQALAVSLDGSELYVADEGGPLLVLSTATGQPLGSVAQATAGFGLVLSPDGAKLYMTSPNAGVVFEVDRLTRQVLRTINTGGSPRRIGFAANGTVLVVTNESGWVDLL